MSEARPTWVKVDGKYCNLSHVKEICIYRGRYRNEDYYSLSFYGPEDSLWYRNFPTRELAEAFVERFIALYGQEGIPEI